MELKLKTDSIIKSIPDVIPVTYVLTLSSTFKINYLLVLIYKINCNLLNSAFGVPWNEAQGPCLPESHGCNSLPQARPTWLCVPPQLGP